MPALHPTARMKKIQETKKIPEKGTGPYELGTGQNEFCPVPIYIAWIRSIAATEFS